MLRVKAKSGPSEIEGTGLFADQFIPKGTVVWSFLHGFDRVFPGDYPESLPAPLKAWFKSAASFDDGVWTLAGDHAVLMNHSDDANVRLSDGATNKGEADMVAARDIRKGEELTVRYWEFDAPSRERGGAAVGEENYMSRVSDYMSLFRTTAGLTRPEPLDEVSAAQRKVLDLQQTLAGLLKDSVKSWGDIAYTYSDSYGRKVTRKATVSAPMPSVVANVRGGYTALIALMETPYQVGAPMHARVIRQLPAHRQVEMPLASLAEELTDYDFTLPDEPDADKGEYRAKNVQIAKSLDVALKAVQKGVKGFKVSILQRGDSGSEWMRTYWAKLDMMPDTVRAPVVAKSIGEAQKPKAVKATSAEDVADLFQGKTTETGGRLKVLRVEKDFVYIEPLNRERLDHYGTSYSDDGEEQEGWDDEGWSENYAIPLYKEVEAILKSYGIKGWSAEIGEKGHIDLQRVAGK